MLRVAVLACLLTLATAPPSADAQPTALAPAVARPVLGQGIATRKPGTVFFLKTAFEPGAVAVGTAHNIPWQELAAAEEVRFELGRSERHVSVSSRLVAPPGRPFREAGGSLRGDFLLYALDLPPSHVRVLEGSTELPPLGARVRLLGIPSTLPHDEDDVFGTVTAAGPERLQVDLDVPFDLRGWGGAPIVEVRSGKAVGILQAAFPRDEGVSVAATPIDAVLEALADPLEGGDGRPFASFPERDADLGEARAPKSAPRRVRAPEPPTEASPGGLAADLTPKRKPRTAEDLVLEIRHPPEGAVIGDAAGAFLAGTALAPLGDYRGIDVAFVIDTSGSTRDPTGADVDGDGIVGERRLGPFGNTDADDSILAAEVAAARHFVDRLDPRSTRVAIISFASADDQGGGGFILGGRRRAPRHAITEVALTRDYESVHRALDRILERGPEGMTHMAAGADRAIIELLGLRGAVSESDRETERIAVLLTDGKPSHPYPSQRDNERAVIRAARRAAKGNIRFHTYGIGDEALDGPIAIVELAAITGGTFTPIRHPADLADVITEIDFHDIDDFLVRNDTTGELSESVLRNPDGSWSALVPVVVGANEITVVASTSDGLRASQTVTVHYAPGSTDPIVPRELVAQRNELLQRRLVELRRERIAAEREAADAARRELKLEIEREREAALERAEKQRKELEIDTIRDEEAR